MTLFPSRLTPLARTAFAVLAVALATPPAASPDPLAPVYSLGKPPTLKPFTGAFYGLDRSGEQNLSGGGAYLGVYKDLMPSIVGIGVSAEAYAGGYSGLSGLDGGVRAVGELRSLFLKAGLDYSFAREDASFLLSLTLPLRRGGILGRGTTLRLDWLPGRRNSWAFGIQVPLEPHMGRTRPRDTEVDMPKAPAPKRRAALDPEVRAALAEVRSSARGVAVLSSPFWPDRRQDEATALTKTKERILEFQRIIESTGERRPRGVTMDDEVRILHEDLDRAFALAAGAGEKGAPLGDLARQTALDEVLFPYNRAFGQYKRPEELWGLAAKAGERFAASPALTAVDAGRRDAVAAVFSEYLAILEATRAWWVKRLESDSRLAWLPFPLALLPEQHDSQEEIDAILARATATPLEGGNTVLYFAGQQFQVELQRQIRAAEDYHVLWLHDYDGVDHAEQPDVVGYYITVEGYLDALTERVRAFDRTGRLPVYMILVDLNYWEGNRGRLYTDVLQEPLRATPNLPGQDTAQGQKLQRGLVEAQERLRRAVAESKGLQEEAARRGEDWLRRYVAVHLNVMNPADFSYRTSRLIGHFPIAPDNVVRDHRKIAFRDITELDPARGEALYGGVGVGEQYTTATWEDRAVRLTGPAALTVKAAARRYLEANGVRGEQMPPPLRPLPRPADYDERVRALEVAGWTARAMEVHNERGFAGKDASVASAVLYTLMPPGSLIVVPDSIWTHELWAAHLVAAALRGCHVYVVAPAASNAPSAGFPQLSRTREIFRRFFEIQSLLGPQIEARGGRLRTGLYTRKAGVDDLRARFREMHDTFTRSPFLKEDFPFPPEFYEGLAKADERLTAAGYQPDARLPEDAAPRAPKLHRKTQLFVTREALDTLVRDPRVQGVIADQMRFAVRRGVTFDAEGLADPKAELAPLFVPLLEAWRGLPEDLAARSLLYMTVGSLNKDARGMMTDGEVLQVTAGAWAMWAVSDMWMLAGSTTWIESQEELDRLLPPYKQWQRRVGRWVRKLI